MDELLAFSILGVFALAVVAQICISIINFFKKD